jgi:hypothetical protein
MNIFETTLINLRVLQSLECHSRLDTTERLFKIHTSSQWVPIFLKRWWASQNRQTDISRIQSLYQQAIQCIADESNSESGRMTTYVDGSKRGLKNLQTTYANDKTMVALIDVILDSIQQLSVDD